MFVKWLSAVASLFLMLSCNPTIKSSSLQQAKMRDLSGYEKAGPYTIELNLDAPARANIEAEVREFLWNHWQQRRLGYVRVTLFSKEGEPSASSYFVEPDEKSAWRIAVKIDRTMVNRGDSKSQRHESVEYGAYFVERIEVPKDGLTHRAVLPDGERRSPQSYRLALKDEKGKSLTEI